jgi:LmbE family N-acetylglucosaminyl deacetylase
VLPLSLASESSARPEILCIGAHCDDIEIGCGGTLLTLQRRYPDCRIHWLVFTSVPERRSEAALARESFVAAAARGNEWIGELRDGFLPAHFQELKTTFEEVARTVEPDLVLTHHGRDRHQDHSLISEMTWQTFRNHMIWEYEIPKYDGDLTTPNLYVPMSAGFATGKVERIMRAFPSQSDKSWFTAENLLAVMRIRGLESRSPAGYAEAFHCRKLVFDSGSSSVASR